MMRPCPECGELTTTTYCPVHTPRDTRKRTDKQPADKRGYGQRWRVLSERARRLQPFCSDCGTTTNLTADHSPEAWRRHDAGLPIRLQDIDVVCMACNVARGPARGPNVDRTA